jgi:hypothetical protein
LINIEPKQPRKKRQKKLKHKLGRAIISDPMDIKGIMKEYYE